MGLLGWSRFAILGFLLVTFHSQVYADDLPAVSPTSVQGTVASTEKCEGLLLRKLLSEPRLKGTIIGEVYPSGFQFSEEIIAADDIQNVETYTLAFQQKVAEHKSVKDLVYLIHRESALTLSLFNVAMESQRPDLRHAFAITENQMRAHSFHVIAGLLNQLPDQELAPYYYELAAIVGNLGQLQRTQNALVILDRLLGMQPASGLEPQVSRGDLLFVALEMRRFLAIYTGDQDQWAHILLYTQQLEKEKEVPQLLKLYNLYENMRFIVFPGGQSNRHYDYLAPVGQSLLNPFFRILIKNHSLWPSQVKDPDMRRVLKNLMVEIFNLNERESQHYISSDMRVNGQAITSQLYPAQLTEVFHNMLDQLGAFTTEMKAQLAERGQPLPEGPGEDIKYLH